MGAIPHRTRRVSGADDVLGNLEAARRPSRHLAALGAPSLRLDLLPALEQHLALERTDPV